MHNARKRTAQDDIATPDELPLDVDLRDRRPLAVLLDSLSQLLIRKAVEALELVRRDPLETRNNDGLVSRRAGVAMRI